MPEADPAAVSRRRFLQGASGLCFSFLIPLPGPVRAGNAKMPQAISAWVRVESNNRITIASPAAELGQGSMTAIPMIFAEEFDADWDTVNIEFSAADDAIFQNPTPWVRGIMLTLGSSAVSGYYDAVRLYGARARKVLMTMAASHWEVPLGELATDASVVVHARSGRRLSYGRIVDTLAVPASLPDISPAELKAESDFRIIGSAVPRYDIPQKVNGSALYSIDVDLPGMLYATVTHSPVKGAVPLGIPNQLALESARDITGVVRLPDAVAIVARNYEAALRAEKDLQVEWSRVDRLHDYSDGTALEAHLRTVRDSSLHGMPIQQEGDVREAEARISKRYRAEYLADYLYHAQLEPLNAVAHVNSRDNSVDVWAGTQAPTHCVRSVAAELGISEDKVRLHRSYLGGAFGRRGGQDHDYVIDAVQLSKHVQAPVKVIWSREADVRSGRFKPIKAIAMEAGEDANGRLISWHHRTASDEALKQSDPYRYEKARGWPVISSSGMAIDYDIDHILAEIFDPDTGVRAAPLRGIGGTINKFAGESFLDEIALAKKIDPLELRLSLLHKHEMAQKVLSAVARMSGWENRRPGDGLGMAFDSVYYPSAYVVRVTLDKNTGVIRVAKVWVAVDVGIAVHPRNIVGQMEGQVIFGISNVLKERITMSKGAVEQSNFHDYPLIRMNEIPEIEVAIITRENSKPLGVGDSRLAALPAAIANAFADLSGKRLRHLPFIPTRVQAVLAS